MTPVNGKQSLGQRDTQEDAFRIVHQSAEDPNADILILLADGMGGHAGGEVASNLALETFERHFTTVSQNPKPRQRLKEALLAANNAIGTRVREEPALSGMGCTVLGTLKIGNRLLWVSVGDSILFLYRDGALRRLNADHSLYGELIEMVQAGKMTQAEADAHPRRNALRSAVMGEPISLIDLNGIEMQPGDLAILATDGLETLSDPEISKIIAADARADVRALSSDLLNAVDQRAKPNQDNTTVVIYRHESDGQSGLYRDSRWRLSGGGRNIGKNLAIAVGAILGLAAMIFMVWQIGFGHNSSDGPATGATPLPSVDRAEGVIGGGNNKPDQPDGAIPPGDTGDSNAPDGGRPLDPEAGSAPKDNDNKPSPPRDEPDNGTGDIGPGTDSADPDQNTPDQPETPQADPVASDDGLTSQDP